MFKEFRDFMTRGNVLALAIGLAIGLAFVTLTTAISKYLIDPIVGSLSSGGIDNVLRIHLRGANYIQLGSILSAVFVFLVTCAVIFFLIVRPLLRMGYSVGDKE